MIPIMEERSFDKRAISLMDEQGYSIDDVRNYVREYITGMDRYSNIRLAYDSDYSTSYSASEVDSFIDGFIEDYIIPKIIEVGSNYKWDYSELFSDVIEENSDVIMELNDSFEDLADHAQKDYDDEIAALNQWYNSTRL